MNFQSSCLLLKLRSYTDQISRSHQVTIYHTLLGRNNLKILTMPKFYTDSLLACEFLLLDKIFTAKRILKDKLPREYGIQLLIIACSLPIRGGIRAYQKPQNRRKKSLKTEKPKKNSIKTEIRMRNCQNRYIFQIPVINRSVNP